MSNKAESISNRFDPVLWILVVAIVLGGVYANTVFVAVNVLIRAVAGLGLAAVAIAIALQTGSGHAGWQLAKEARVEVRKVIWPTRQETTQTTMIVVGVVILVALLLWGLDSALSWGIQAIIG
ncbi:MAG: preprotein translocase subunit SecE [bacterium]|nr:preprotein translocase subunit SecE [Gammaproteobacteria bacterium]HIL97193.1 preprotein translocase subunit SecE [Pseudomonadales bacterium]